MKELRYKSNLIMKSWALVIYVGIVIFYTLVKNDSMRFIEAKYFALLLFPPVLAAQLYSWRNEIKYGCSLIINESGIQFYSTTIPIKILWADIERMYIETTQIRFIKVKKIKIELKAETIQYLKQPTLIDKLADWVLQIRRPPITIPPAALNRNIENVFLIMGTYLKEGNLKFRVDYRNNTFFVERRTIMEIAEQYSNDKAKNLHLEN